MDGILNTRLSKTNEECTHTSNTGSTKPWWLIDLEKQERVTHVALTNRGDCCRMLFNITFSSIGRNGFDALSEIYQNYVSPKGQRELSEFSPNHQQHNSAHIV